MFDPVIQASATILPAIVAALLIVLFVWQRTQPQDATEPASADERERTPFTSLFWALAISAAVITGYFGSEVFEKYQSSKTGYGSMAYAESSQAGRTASSNEGENVEAKEAADDSPGEPDSDEPNQPEEEPQSETIESTETSGQQTDEQETGGEGESDESPDQEEEASTDPSNGTANDDQSDKPKMPKIDFAELRAPAMQVFQSALKPIEARHWIPAVALGSIAFALLAGWFTRWGMLVNWLLFTALMGLMAYAVLRNSVYMTMEWKPQESYLYLAGIAGIAGLAWLFIVSEVPGNKRRTLFLAGVVAVCTAITIASSGSLKYGLLSGTVASAMGGAFLASVIFRRVGNNVGWATPVIALTTLMLIVSHFFAELDSIHAGLLIASWLLVGLRPSSGWFVGILSLLPGLIAAGWAAMEVAKQTGAG